MIAEAELDALVIAAPTTSHLPLALAAIERGIAILVEKPLAATVDEAEEIVRAAAERGVPVQVGHVERFNPAVVELGRLLDEGWLSTVYAITSRRAGPFPARIRDVGVTVDLATHDVDILSWIAGERPVRVYAETAQRIHADHEDLLFGLLHFPSGATGMLDVNWLTPAKRRQLVVVGEEGMFELDYLSQRLTFTRADAAEPLLIQGYAPTFAGEVAELPVSSGEPLAAEIEAFVKVVRDGSRPPIDGRDGLWAVALATALLSAAASGRPVDMTEMADEDPDRMTITTRPSATGPSLLGGSIELPPNPCRHAPARSVSPWTGESGTAGRVAVVGAGKMGLPLCAQFAGHGWDVIAVDVQQAVVDAINEGRSHVGEEPGLADLVLAAHEAGRLRATTDGAAAAKGADVVVLIVPVMLDDERQPDYRYMDSAVDSIGPGSTPARRSSSRRRCPSATRGVAICRGSRRRRGCGPRTTSSSRSRPSACTAARRSGTWRPTRSSSAVSARGPDGRAAEFYDSVLDAEVVLMSNAEAAEFSKLADTTYRDVNIALANEFSRYAERVGVDIQEVIAAANSQPYSHIHQPGIGVGGHCIPVYPHFLLSRAPELELVELSRRVNDGQVGHAIKALQKALGGLEGVPVLVLGLTYRDGVKELAYSRAMPLIDRLGFHGAVVTAFDPLLSPDEVAQCCATPYAWGERSDARAIVTQTADPLFRELDFSLFPDLELVYDGRNSLRGVELPRGVVHQGVGIGVLAAAEEASRAGAPG